MERDTSLELATYCLLLCHSPVFSNPSSVTSIIPHFWGVVMGGVIFAAPTAVDFVGGGVLDAPRMGNPFISY